MILEQSLAGCGSKYDLRIYLGFVRIKNSTTTIKIKTQSFKPKFRGVIININISHDNLANAQSRTKSRYCSLTIPENFLKLKHNRYRDDQHKLRTFSLKSYKRSELIETLIPLLYKHRKNQLSCKYLFIFIISSIVILLIKS